MPHVAAPESAPPPRIDTVLVALDGTPESDPAIDIARLIADRHDARVQVVSVCEPVRASVGRDPRSPPRTEAHPAEEREARLCAVADQLARTVGDSTGWPIVTAAGTMDRALARAALVSGAQLTITGRGRHDLASIAFQDTHLLPAIRTGVTPVYAAAGRARALPARVVIASDFSEHSARAAAFALGVIDEVATIYFVHAIEAPGIDVPFGDTWKAEREAAIRANLEQCCDHMHLPSTITAECIVLAGPPGNALVDFARAANADLVVVGAHGRSFLRRSVLGSVATRVVRTAPCAVLCIPPATVRVLSPAERTRARAHSIPRAEWRQSLAEFCARHRETPVRMTTSRAGGREPSVRSGTLLGVEDEPGGYIVDFSLPGGARGERLTNIAAVTAFGDTRTAPVALEVEHGRGCIRFEEIGT